MNKYHKGSDSMGMIWIGSLALSITSGILSWNWIEPESFLGAIWWLIVWGFLSYVGHIIIGLVVVAIGESGNSQHPPPLPPDYTDYPPDYPIAPADTSFTVIQRKKNQEYVLSHKIYGSQIHMNSDDSYNPGDTFELDMTDYKVC